MPQWPALLRTLSQTIPAGSGYKIQKQAPNDGQVLEELALLGRTKHSEKVGLSERFGGAFPVTEAAFWNLWGGTPLQIAF